MIFLFFLKKATQEKYSNVYSTALLLCCKDIQLVPKVHPTAIGFSVCTTKSPWATTTLQMMELSHQLRRRRGRSKEAFEAGYSLNAWRWPGGGCGWAAAAAAAFEDDGLFSSFDPSQDVVRLIDLSRDNNNQGNTSQY